MAEWQEVRLPPDQAGEGFPSLRLWRHLRSPQLQNYRDILVALPPSYPEGERRYPVIYMHDGQNLFDPTTSYAGDWDLLATLRALAADGIEAVVVGVANMGRFRRFEYSPFRDPKHGGGDGDRYLRFVVETVRPLVDASFPTLTGPEHTAMAGSSMGGLMSLYALYRRPDVFGSAAALSPSVWFADAAMHRLVESDPAPPGRLYLDVGTAEAPTLVADVRRLRDLLLERGFEEGPRFRYLEDEGASHHETHWGRRFREALPFLLGTEGRNDGKKDEVPA